MAQTLDIQPPGPIGRVMIPPAGMPRTPTAQAPAEANPYMVRDATHIVLTDKVQSAGILIGNVTCNCGDVIKIERDPKGLPANANVMTTERADALLKIGLARYHSGPATKHLSNPTRKDLAPDVVSPIEHAEQSEQIERESERAVGRPQRRGQM